MTQPANASIEARAHANIALVKYWGKADVASNAPAVGSLSITLEALATTTRVSLQDEDEVLFNGAPAPAEAPRLQAFLDRVRGLAGTDTGFRVDTGNNFPTGAGLASSASGFAALALAATAAAGLDLSPPELSALAQLGSGSAARSLYGGFAEMDAGTTAGARPLYPGSHWPLEVVIAIVSETRKAIGSTEGMEHTRDTAPYYAAWLETHLADMNAARSAIGERNFTELARVSESSCLKMHGVMLAADPGLVYWQAPTLSCIHAVRELREAGVEVFFTIDAGPQVKAIAGPGHGDRVADALAGIPGVSRVIRSALGPAAHRVAS